MTKEQIVNALKSISTECDLHINESIALKQVMGYVSGKPDTDFPREATEEEQSVEGCCGMSCGCH